MCEAEHDGPMTINCQPYTVANVDHVCGHTERSRNSDEKTFGTQYFLDGDLVPWRVLDKLYVRKGVSSFDICS